MQRILSAAALPIGVCALALLPGNASAQLRRQGPSPSGLDLVVRGGRQFDLDAWSVGGQVRLPVNDRFLLAPNADLFLNGSPHDWQASIDLVLRPTGGSSVSAGVGVGWRHQDFVSDTSAVVIAPETRRGTSFFITLLPAPDAARSVRPLIEARWLRIRGRSPFHLLFGLSIALTNPNARRR